MAAVDLGIKASTPRNLAARGCEVLVVPATATAEQILAASPDGVFFSNGPGDPAAATYAVDAMRGVLDAGVPVFGICLGSQILARALGLGTYKLRYGHRGVNQPVMDLATGRVYITSHNHGFAAALPGTPGEEDGVSAETPPETTGSPAGPATWSHVPARARQPFGTPYGPAVVSHVNLNDGVVEGLRLLERPVFSVQYHPEAAPGPHDAADHFDHFCALLELDEAGWATGAMPRREDLKSVLVIGSGPIVIGQGCEFDYSGTQACRVLKAEGIRVSLVNSNPATIMTDPEFADATYVEPITTETLEKVIAIQRPDAVLPTLGGQTALNAAVALHDQGVLHKYNVELIGANIDAIRAGEDRERFKEIVTGLGAEVPRSTICRDLDECLAATEAPGELGYPVVIRPSFTLGGLGSGIANDEQDLRRIAGTGLDASPTHEVLLEESILGWKEFELELMRDQADNVVVVCSIENIDPMGVHTGDSVTVAPGDDAHRPRVPADARHRDRHHARGRGGHRRLQHPVRGGAAHRPDGRDRDEPARLAAAARWPPRPPGSRSPRSRPGWPSATPSTRSRTTSPGRPRPASSPRSTTWWSRSRGSRSRSSPAPTPRSPPT